MKSDIFFQSLNEIDTKYFDEALSYKGVNKKLFGGKCLAAAACLCLLFCGSMYIGKYGFWQIQQENPGVIIGENVDLTYEESEAFGFTIEGREDVIYFPISFEERKRYGLVPENAVGLTPENTYVISQKDIGEFMGVVEFCGDESLLGCKVYHFAAYPDYDAICIVEKDGAYAFYTADGIRTDDTYGQNSDIVLETYSLPESAQAIEILSADETYLFSIEDDKARDSLFSLLAGKGNSGLQANEKRFAKAWYDAFGNEDVYYSEKEGHCVFRNDFEDEAEKEVKTYTDAEGNIMVQKPANEAITLYETAHALWSEGERLIRISTDKGFQTVIDYFPSINTFIWHNGYYELSADEAKELNALLQIEKE